MTASRLTPPGTECSISMERVQDVSLQKEFYEKSSITSSMGRAFVGALIAGPTGAIISGRPKEKRTIHSASFLVIEYAGADGELTQMVFTIRSFEDMKRASGEAFSGSDELIAFMEQVNKQFVIGGASAQGQSAASLIDTVLTIANPAY